MDRAAEIAEMHTEYQRLTGYPVVLAGREWTWFEWLKRGLTVEDLRLLIREKRRRIRAGELTPQSLTFRNLAGNADYAEEDIAVLRARSRGPTIDRARADVLRASGRTEDRGQKSEVRGQRTEDGRRRAEAYGARTGWTSTMR